MTAIRVGTASAASGTRADGVIHGGRLVDSSPVDIPVAVFNGARPGRKVWIHGAIHGDEYVGTRAIQQLIARLDPSEMSGALVAIPVANISAFRAGTRAAPQDGLDMNRVWPGAELDKARALNPHSEVIVHRMFEAMTTIGIDAVIDCHTGGSWCLMANWAAYADYGDAAVEAGRLAEAAAFDVIWGRKREFIASNVSGSAGDVLSSRGIPYVVLEAGGLTIADRAPVAATVRGLENILKATKVITGEPDVPMPARRVTKGHWMRAREGGLFERRVDLLQAVEKGSVIGVVYDVLGHQLDELRAPATGIVIGLRYAATVASGDYVGNVSEPERS
jgi:predicted deacylase